MSQYCTTEDLQNILPNRVIIGTNLQAKNVNVTTTRVAAMIQHAAGIIDSYLSTIYRIPLVKYKEPDYSADPITFIEVYPPPIILINARLAAANIYDHVMMAGQSPGVSDWGKNQRSLAFDDLREIQSGVSQLRGQDMMGLRFVRQNLLDASRSPHRMMGTSMEPVNRQAGS
jgi:hypothetical protein